MKYKSVVVTRHGGPEVLVIAENDLRQPAAGEVRIRTLAAAVSRPDITVRTGEALYAGTPLGQKIPFVPGYAIVGRVDAVGEGVREFAVGNQVGALTVIGGYSEYVYWKSTRLISVPNRLNPVEVVPLVLNYLVAYQTLHRSAGIKTGERVLLIGASGGIGTALLQLGQLARLKMYALASRNKHAVLAHYGAIPIDYHSQDFVEVIRRAEPDGLDAVISGMTRMDYIHRGISVLRRGGRLVSFGEPDSFSTLFQVLRTMLSLNLLLSGKRIKLYGTSTYFLGNHKPYLEDWATLLKLLEEGKIRPIIEKTYPLLEAAQANALLESGQVTGNVVLVAPELL
jgi:NADPH:quinone reductase-like Zn-dependent oxidoreductase